MERNREMIKLINYKYDSKGEVIYLAKSSIAEIKRIGKENMTHIWNKDSHPTEYVVKETPEEILAMPDIEEGNKTIDWEQRRYEIAKHLLPRVFVFGEHKYSAKYAVSYADALIKELKKGGEK